MSLSQTKKIISEKNLFQILEDLKDAIRSLKSNIPNNIEPETKIKINEYFLKMYNLLDIILTLLDSNMAQYESLKRKDEETIRVLYGKMFNQKLINEILENKIGNLHKKEKEYELLKQKTGAIVCNGQIICNERKDNEIIILRTENSLLKTAIKNNEDLLKEKTEIINSLNNDLELYKSQLDDLSKIIDGKYSSFSNINININEPKPKKEYSQKDIKFKRENSYINKTIHVFPSKNIINNTLNNNKNSINNIYSSYQMNSQLINRINNSKNKNRLNNKEEIFNNCNNVSKTKNETIDSLNNKTYSIKYISVNKSLFSPKCNKHNKLHGKKTLQINRLVKSKYILNNNLSNREYNTISIDPNIKNEVKVKKILTNKKIYIKHRKANTIQWSDNSLKKLILGKKENSLSNENNMNSHAHSGVKIIPQIKGNNHTLKKYTKSLPPSILCTIAEGFRKNKKINKSLTKFLMSYADKKYDNRGRNINHFNSGAEHVKDNSLSYLQKTIMNRTSCENNSNNDKNSFNNIYNNSQEIFRDINFNIKK